MKKNCDICWRELEDGDEIVAAVVTVFHRVPSNVAFAVERPIACLRMVHIDCFAECSDDTKSA